MINKGGWVCYAPEFYRRIASYNSPVRGRKKNKFSAHQPFQHGEVLAVTGSAVQWARVAWDDGTISSALLSNLVLTRYVFFPHKETGYQEQLLNERIELLSRLNTEFGRVQPLSYVIPAGP